MSPNSQDSARKHEIIKYLLINIKEQEDAIKNKPQSSSQGLQQPQTLINPNYGLPSTSSFRPM